jgi:hypothetical protein
MMSGKVERFPLFANHDFEARLGAVLGLEPMRWVKSPLVSIMVSEIYKNVSLLNFLRFSEASSSLAGAPSTVRGRSFFADRANGVVILAGKSSWPLRQTRLMRGHGPIFVRTKSAFGC